MNDASLLLIASVIGLLAGLLIGKIWVVVEYWRGYGDGEQNGYRCGIAKRKGLKVYEPMED